MLIHRVELKQLQFTFYERSIYVANLPCGVETQKLSKSLKKKKKLLIYRVELKLLAVVGIASFREGLLIHRVELKHHKHFCILA